LRPEAFEAKVKEVREKHGKAIFEQLAVVHGEAERLQKTESYWKDKTFLLSQAPLTENPTHEPLARLSALTEFAKMPDYLLRANAELAKDDKRLAELHLLRLEHESRASSPGWTPLSLDGLELPDQKEALSLLSESRQLAAEVPLRLKAAEGRQVTPLDKLSVARTA